MHGTVSPNLSARERAIIQAVSAGRSNAEIAMRSCIGSGRSSAS